MGKSSKKPETDLFEAFMRYIEACKEKSGILLDTIALSDLVTNPKKIDEFISELESTEEFEELAKQTLQDQTVKSWLQPYFYKEPKALSALHNFFRNSRAYEWIISEREFKAGELFNKFCEETQKEIVLCASGILIGLGVEFDMTKEIGLVDFSLEKCRTVWACLRVKCTQDNPLMAMSPKDIIEPAILLINLYFGQPIYLPHLNLAIDNLFSDHYVTERSPESPGHAKESDYYDLSFDRVCEYIHTGYSLFSGDPEFEEEYSELLKDLEVTDEELSGTLMQYEEEGVEYYDIFDPTLLRIFLKGRQYLVRAGQGGNWLPKSEIDDFASFITKTKGFMKKQLAKKENHYIEIAVNFFKRSHSSPPCELNIINYTIALEALYLENEQELAEKLSNRVANLIGTTEEEKAEIRKNCIRIYGIRSMYVHGGKVKINDEFKKKFDISENNFATRKLEYWLRDIVRKSILVFLSLSKYYGKGKDKEDKEDLYNKLSNPFDSKSVKEIQKQALEFLSMARP